MICRVLFQDLRSQSPPVISAATNLLLFSLYHDAIATILLEPISVHLPLSLSLAIQLPFSLFISTGVLRRAHFITSNRIAFQVNSKQV